MFVSLGQTDWSGGKACTGSAIRYQELGSSVFGVPLVSVESCWSIIWNRRRVNSGYSAHICNG